MAPFHIELLRFNKVLYVTMMHGGVALCLNFQVIHYCAYCLVLCDCLPLKSLLTELIYATFRSRNEAM